MTNFFYKELAKAHREITRHPRKCEICGETETLENIMLKYDNGKIMCDDCAIAYYEKLDKEDGKSDE